MKHGGSLAPPPSRAAAEVFGDRLALAVAYAELLASTGIEHGLIGPRETPRLWDRHIVNCAVMESLLPHQSKVVDIGSGAGLPGLVLAIARPDLQVTLIEPLQRRTNWLDVAIQELGLSHVRVWRGRAQDFAGRVQVPVVTARAVARLDKLYGWASPLLPEGGSLIALKGQSAAEELAECSARLQRMGGVGGRVITVGQDVLDPPSRLIEVTRGKTQTETQAPSRRR